MTEEKKILVGGINADDAYYMHGDGDYNSSLNADFVRHHGRQGRFEAVAGTRKVDNLEISSGVNLVIGSYLDLSKNRLFYLVYNEGGDHGIYCYDHRAGVIRTVLRNEDVTGGLGFSADHLVNGIFLVNDVLYWNDELNEQRRVNVEAAMAAYDADYSAPYSYVFPITRRQLSLIRRQPGMPLFATKVSVPSTEVASSQVGDDAFQFTWRFIYRDDEVSRLGPLSELVDRNEPGSTANAIDIALPLGEKIEQDVAVVEIVAKNITTNAFYIIKRFTREKDGAAFDDHNSGTAMSLRFLNDTVGIAIADSQAIIQFDSVPIRSKTMEIANSRIFLGNNTEGYDTQTVTSLVATSSVTGGGSSPDGVWFNLQFHTLVEGVQVVAYDINLIQIVGTYNQDGFYEWNAGSVPPFPASIPYGELGFRGHTVEEVMEFIGGDAYPGGTNVLDSFTPLNEISDVTGTTEPTVPVTGTRVFKSASAYRIGIAFHDDDGRKSGVYTDERLKLITPDRAYGDIAFTQTILWNLSTADALQEIPEWASYYSINITKCLRTRSFFSLKADDVKYADKDTDGNWIYSDTYATTRKGIAIDVKSMFGYGIGYDYLPGDIIKLYPEGSSTVHQQKIIAQSGDYIICDLVNLGDVSALNMVYEVYTPYKELGNEPIYEVAQVFRINNPGTEQRMYSVLAGGLPGDTWLVTRSKDSQDYVVEAMTMIDKYWQSWYTDHGRPNFIDTIGQQKKANNISFSNQYINGTKVNGLSAFDPLDETNEIPIEGGPIQKLQLVSKPQEPGTVMLCIQENETSSLYLGETEVNDGSASPILATTRNVIGSINVLKGGYGTLNHESVARWKGNVYYWDLNRACVVMYGANGLETPSEFKTNTLFRRIADDMLYAMSNSTEDGVLQSRMHVVGGINPSTGEYIISFPSLFMAPRGEILYDQIIEEINIAPTGPFSQIFSIQFLGGA